MTKLKAIAQHLLNTPLWINIYICATYIIFFSFSFYFVHNLLFSTMIGEQRCITLRAEQQRLGAILSDAMCLSKEGGEKDKKNKKLS